MKRRDIAASNNPVVSPFGRSRGLLFVLDDDEF